MDQAMRDVLHAPGTDALREVIHRGEQALKELPVVEGILSEAHGKAVQNLEQAWLERADSDTLRSCVADFCSVRGVWRTIIRRVQQGADAQLQAQTTVAIARADAIAPTTHPMILPDEP